MLPTTEMKYRDSDSKPVNVSLPLRHSPLWWRTSWPSRSSAEVREVCSCRNQNQPPPPRRSYAEPWWWQLFPELECSVVKAAERQVVSAAQSQCWIPLWPPPPSPQSLWATVLPAQERRRGRCPPSLFVPLSLFCAVALKWLWALGD